MAGMYAYLADAGGQDAEVLRREIPWETYSTARLITEKDLQLIRRYDKRAEELRTSMLDEAGPAYVEAFVSVLKNVTKEETVQYVLALLLQMLQENPARARLFHQQSEQHMASAPDPYTTLIRLLQRQDWYTLEKACKLLTVVVESRPKKLSSAFANGVLSSDPAASSTIYGSPDPAEAHISTFIDWLVSKLKDPPSTAKGLPTVVCALAALLKERGIRVLFFRAGGMRVLPGLLKSCNSPTNSQLMYELSLCAWQMTYVKAAVESVGGQLVRALVDVCRSAQKEKVFRIALSALRNLLSYEDLGLAADMVEAGLPKVVITKQMQTWGDEDISEMLTFMDEKLKEGIQVLSSFEKYKKELLAGALDWSPMHTSEQFWRDNIDKFEEKEFAVLRVLLKLLEQCRDSKVVAVACHDLGQFILYHPQGRYIVNDLRGKELVMRLMSHPDADVKKQALLCVQKIMLTKDKLEFLSS